MANRYANIPGASKISQTYNLITEGFDKVQQDVDQLQDELAQEISDREAAVQAVDERVDQIISEPSPNKDPELVDIRTPDSSYTPLDTITTAGGMTRDMQKQFVAHLADTAQLKDEVIFATQSGKTNRKRVVTFLYDDAWKADLSKASVFDANNVKMNGCIITESVGEPLYLTWEDIKDLVSRGHEYGSHTKTHMKLDEITDVSILEDEIGGSKQIIQSHGVDPKFIAYPYGSSNELVRSIARKHYSCGIKADGGVNYPPIANYHVWRVPADPLTLTELKAKVDELEQMESGWMCFMFHSGGTMVIDDNELDQLIKYIKSKNIDIVTISEAMELYGNKIEVGDFTKTDFADGTWRDGNKTYALIDSTGKLYMSNDAHRVVVDNEKTESNVPSDFEYNKITVTNRNNFSLGNGVMHTHRTRGDRGETAYTFQILYVNHDNPSYPIYKREWNGSAWRSWRLISVGMIKATVAVNGGTALNVPARSAVEYDVDVPGVTIRSKVLGGSLAKIPMPIMYNLNSYGTGRVTIRFVNVGDTDVNLYGNHLQWELLVYLN